MVNEVSYCSLADLDLLNVEPVLRVHTFASYCHFPNLNQQQEKNGHRRPNSTKHDVACLRFGSRPSNSSDAANHVTMLKHI